MAIFCDFASVTHVLVYYTRHFCQNSWTKEDFIPLKPILTSLFQYLYLPWDLAAGSRIVKRSKITFRNALWIAPSAACQTHSPGLRNTSTTWISNPTIRCEGSFSRVKSVFCLRLTLSSSWQTGSPAALSSLCYLGFFCLFVIYLYPHLSLPWGPKALCNIVIPFYPYNANPVR